MTSLNRFALIAPSIGTLLFLAACTDGPVLVGDVADTGVGNDTGEIDLGAVDGGATADAADADGGPTVCNLPWQATAIGDCRAEVGVRWNGEYCERVWGCSCEGPDCPAVVASGDAYACYDEVRARGCDLYDVMITNRSGDSTSEAGDSATFAYELTRRPTSDVSVHLVSTNAAEGTVTPSDLIFSATSSLQTITVTGVDDSVVDGDQTYFVQSDSVSSDDPTYNGFIFPSVTLRNLDNDGACLVVTPTEDLETVEGGAAAEVSVSLCSQPTADRTVAISSDSPTDGAGALSSLVFTTANWNVPQSVLITSEDNAIADGEFVFHVSLTEITVPASDPIVLTVTRIDNDTPAIRVTPRRGLVTDENGRTATFTISLTTAPTADVSISVSSSNTLEGVVSPSTLVFNSFSGSLTQTVTVTGVDDNAFDGDVAYQIITSASTSTDLAYSGLSAADVEVTNEYVPSYLKASDTQSTDAFGTSVSVSADGSTMAVGAPNAGRISPSTAGTGAVLIFSRVGTTWSPITELVASNAGLSDSFGTSVALSADGNTLVVGAPMERSNATGVGGNQGDDSLYQAGAAYVFTRSGGVWTQQAYVKPSTIDEGDAFGVRVAISADGNTIAASAPYEDSNAVGIDGDESDNSLIAPGSVFVFTRTGSLWSQQAYIKASHSSDYAEFGMAAQLSGDGDTLVVGADRESSAATGIGGDELDTSAASAGAAYVFTRVAGSWAQQAYIKASDARASHLFGSSVAVTANGNSLAIGSAGGVYSFARSSGEWNQVALVNLPDAHPVSSTPVSVALADGGNLLLVGAYAESSSATRIDGDEGDYSAALSGAAYRFTWASGVWVRTHYIKAPNAEAFDQFGTVVAMPSDGSLCVVGAPLEDSAATGVGGDMESNTASNAGAVYSFR